VAVTKWLNISGSTDFNEADPPGEKKGRGAKHWQTVPEDWLIVSED
jgi:hypothetical protein